MADPSINKDAWTETEERVMAEAHRYTHFHSLEREFISRRTVSSVQRRVARVVGG